MCAQKWRVTNQFILQQTNQIINERGKQHEELILKKQSLQKTTQKIKDMLYGVENNVL